MQNNKFLEIVNYLDTVVTYPELLFFGDYVFEYIERDVMLGLEPSCVLYYAENFRNIYGKFILFVISALGLSLLISK